MMRVPFFETRFGPQKEVRLPTIGYRREAFPAEYGETGTKRIFGRPTGSAIASASM